MHLAELKVVEAAPLMEEAFAARRVDDMVMGDWEDVQIELGLLAERLTPFRPEWSLWANHPPPAVQSRLLAAPAIGSARPNASKPAPLASKIAAAKSADWGKR